jgi:hypothetical protein
MMKSVHSTAWRAVVLLALLFSLLSTAVTQSPARADAAPSDRVDDELRTPLAVEVSMAEMPTVDQTAEVTIVVSSTQPAAGIHVAVVGSDGMRIDGEREFVIELAAGESRRLLTSVTPEVAGNHTVAANVSLDFGGGNVWGDSDAVYFSSGDGTADASFTFAGDPLSGAAVPGPGNTMKVEPEAFADGSMPAFAIDEETEIPIDTGEPGGQDDVAPEGDVTAAAGTLTIRGNVGMVGRNGLWRDQKLLVSLVTSTGAVWQWTYSDSSGNYVFNVSNPGVFRIRVWANYRHDSMQIGAIRVVGDGLQTLNRFSIAGWHYNIPPMGPFPDGEVDVGSWMPDPNWSGSRAWWIYQDLIDAWGYTSSQVPPGQPYYSRQPDGVTVEWEPGSTDGTYYSTGTRRVNLEDIDANSGHTVLHEYGHAVMHNVYDGFPTNDCPSPHYIDQVGGSNCAWTEGFANFFSIGVKADPVYTWGCTLPCTPPSVNLEERYTPGFPAPWATGDRVEGNVAASLWDFIDPYADPFTDGLDETNSAITPFWKIWDVVYNINHNNFNEFWAHWRNTVNLNNSMATLYQNTIDYGWTTLCGDAASEPDDHHLQLQVITNPADGPVQRWLCTDNDVDYHMFDFTAGTTYVIDTFNLGTAGDGSIADTTLTLYRMTQYGGLAQEYDDDNGGIEYLASRIIYTPSFSGRYYVKVRHAAGRGDFNYRYSIDLSVWIPNTAPSITAPTYQLTNGQTLGNPSAGQYTVNVRANWTASDPDDGIAFQSVQGQINNAGFVMLAPSLPGTVRSHDVPMTIGTTNQLQVNATDFAGDSSGYLAGASFGIAGTQQTGFTYTGAWTNHSATSAWGGTFKRANGVSGVKAVYSFTGTNAALVGLQRSDGGRARIYVDGVLKGTVEFYSATAKNRQVLFTVNGLSDAAHTMEVRWINAHHASSTGYRLYLDGAIALDS